MTKKEKAEWIAQLTNVISLHHKRNINKIAEKMFKKAHTVVSSMKSRSKKYGVKCTITVGEILAKIIIVYGDTCTYSDYSRKLDHTNMVFDHTQPISRGGDSTYENIQIISRFYNNVKGDMTDAEMKYFLVGMKIFPEELRKRTFTRLARGGRA